MKTERIHLTIIITCFNYAHFVGRAIESVLEQKHDQCELLVVDDGSSDNSWSVIGAYDPEGAFRVRNGGAARAAMHALRHARGAFVMFLDADDELAPGSLASIVPRLDAEVAKLQFPLTPIDASGAVLGAPSPRLRDGRERDVLQRQVAETGVYVSPPTSGNVFRRDLCDLLGEIDYEMSVDGVTLFAAPFFGDVVSLSTPLGFYRLHAHNYSQAGSRPTAARFRLEADRFAARHDHLRNVLSRRGTALELVPASRTFFYRERRFYQQLLEGVRPSLREVAALQILVFRSTTGFRASVLLAAFFASVSLLPKRWWPALLARRFRPRGPLPCATPPVRGAHGAAA